MFNLWDVYSFALIILYEEKGSFKFGKTFIFPLIIFGIKMLYLTKYVYTVISFYINELQNLITCVHVFILFLLIISAEDSLF